MVPVDRIPVDALRELVRLICSVKAGERSCKGAKSLLSGLVGVLRCCRIVYGVSDAVAPGTAPAWSSVLDVCPGDMQTRADTHWISVHHPHTDAQQILFESLCRKPSPEGADNNGPARRMLPRGNAKVPLNNFSIVNQYKPRATAVTTKACGYSLGACRMRGDPPFEGWELTLLRLFLAELREQRISATNTDIPCPLPPRLRRVLPLLLSGLKINEIADHLRLSPYTVREYIQDIYRHYGIHQRYELNSIGFEPSLKEA